MIFKCFVALMMASSYSLHLGHLLRTAGPKEKTSHSPIRGLTHLLVSLVGRSHLIYYPITIQHRWFPTEGPGCYCSWRYWTATTSVLCNVMQSVGQFMKEKGPLTGLGAQQEQMKKVSPQPTTVRHLSRPHLSLNRPAWGGISSPQSYVWGTLKITNTSHLICPGLSSKVNEKSS